MIVYLIASIVANIILIYFLIKKQPPAEQVVIRSPYVEEELNKEKILNGDLQRKLGELELLHQQQYTMNRNLEDEMAGLRKKIEEESEENRKILSLKRSSEVLSGKLAEKLAPLLDEFPVDIDEGDLIPLFSPIDYLYFGINEIAFIEIKSRKSKLSKKQKDIKDLVLQKKISWKEVRIK